METLADKLAALLCLAAIKVVKLHVSGYYLCFVLWRLRRDDSDLLPEFPNTGFPDVRFIHAFNQNICLAIRRGMRYDPSQDTVELCGIEAWKILVDLREEGRQSSVRRILPLVNRFACMVDPSVGTTCAIMKDD